MTRRVKGCVVHGHSRALSFVSNFHSFKLTHAMPSNKHQPVPTEDPDAISPSTAPTYGAVAGGSSGLPPRYEDDVPDDL